MSETVLTHPLPPVVLTAVDQRVKIVADLIKGDLRRDFSLPDLARQVNLSPARLRLLFKAETGMSPAQYLTALRTQKAKELIETTSLSMKEIRLKVGFDKDEAALSEPPAVAGG